MPNLKNILAAAFLSLKLACGTEPVIPGENTDDYRQNTNLTESTAINYSIQPYFMISDENGSPLSDVAVWYSIDNSPLINFSNKSNDYYALIGNADSDINRTKLYGKELNFASNETILGKLEDENDIDEILFKLTKEGYISQEKPVTIANSILAQTRNLSYYDVFIMKRERIE